MTRQGLRPERGSGTVLAVAGVGLVLACLLGGLTLAAVVRSVHIARAAADLAALAGATAAQQGASGGAVCGRAAEVAVANHSTVHACSVDGAGRVTVEVAAPVRAPLRALSLGPARVRARAGTR